MKYMLLIHVPEDDDASPDVYAEYGKLAAELTERGKMVDGNELARSSTLVRVRSGERLVTDGPFTETKEHLAGYFVVEADDLDEAIDWASRIPGSRTGTIEVRTFAD